MNEKILCRCLIFISFLLSLNVNAVKLTDQLFLSRPCNHVHAANDFNGFPDFFLCCEEITNSLIEIGTNKNEIYTIDDKGNAVCNSCLNPIILSDIVVFDECMHFSCRCTFQWDNGGEQECSTMGCTSSRARKEETRDSHVQSKGIIIKDKLYFLDKI